MSSGRIPPRQSPIPSTYQQYRRHLSPSSSVSFEFHFDLRICLASNARQESSPRRLRLHIIVPRARATLGRVLTRNPRVLVRHTLHAHHQQSEVQSRQIPVRLTTTHPNTHPNTSRHSNTAGSNVLVHLPLRLELAGVGGHSHLDVDFGVCDIDAEVSEALEGGNHGGEGGFVGDAEMALETDAVDGLAGGFDEIDDAAGAGGFGCWEEVSHGSDGGPRGRSERNIGTVRGSSAMVSYERSQDCNHCKRAGSLATQPWQAGKQVG